MGTENAQAQLSDLILVIVSDMRGFPCMTSMPVTR